jgi:hypothetical protein
MRLLRRRVFDDSNIARLVLRVGRARLDRDRDGLLVFFVGVVLFRFAAAANFLADLLVAAAPVVSLAGQFAISRGAPHASRRVVGQWGGAGGAICEDHFCLTVSYEGARIRSPSQNLFYAIDAPPQKDDYYR